MSMVEGKKGSKLNDSPFCLFLCWGLMAGAGEVVMKILSKFLNFKLIVFEIWILGCSWYCGDARIVGANCP